MSSPAKKSAKILLDTKCVLFNAKDPFTYTSGRKGPVYVDCRRLISFPAERKFLMDLGAEYHGYTADITRTIPASGKFSAEQKQIYNLVLKAQEEAMKICKPGTTFAELTQVTKQVVNRGLKELGIIQNVDDRHLYYPHGCCHHIGLDVHDRGNYDALQENMVFIFKPYVIAADGISECNWGDTIVITPEGGRRLGKRPHDLAIAPG